jgi:hypothetical protein
MLLKALRRNVVPATAIAAAGTLTSQTENARSERGVRLYVTLASVTNTGAVDTLYLCAIPPAGGAAVPVAGFSAVALLSTVGVWIFDFYPGAWLPPTLAAGGHLMGAAGVALPLNWAVEAVLGAGSAATITVDAELL